MNTPTFSLETIQQFARGYGMPTQKLRGLLREYIQVKFITDLYSLQGANRLSFVGGTALRLLHDLPRFSEDLDFDCLGQDLVEPVALFAQVAVLWQKQGIAVEYLNTAGAHKTYAELRFPQVLHQLGISSNPREKMRIKLDYAHLWHGQTPQVQLLNRYGFIEQVICNPLAQVLVQKLAAYVGRSTTQPRDMFDIVWLHSQSVRPDTAFMQVNSFSDVLAKAQAKWQQEGSSAAQVRKLEPFMFAPEQARKIHLLGAVLAEIEKQ